MASGQEARYAQGMQALQAGRLEETIHIFKALIRAEAERLGGTTAARESLVKEMHEGEEGMNLAIQQQGKNFYIRSQRAIIRLGRGILRSLAGGDPSEDCKGALEDSTTALDLRQDDISGRINRGNVLIFSARYARDSGKDVRAVFEMARGDLEHALKVEEAHPTALHNMGIAYFYLAALDKRQKKDPVAHYEKAIEWLGKAAEMDPSYSYIFKDLGVCRIALARVFLERGERPRDLLQKAVGDLTIAVDIHAGLYGAYYERGMGFFSLKQFELAVADWEKCLELDASKNKHLEKLIHEAKEKIANRA